MRITDIITTRLLTSILIIEIIVAILVFLYPINIFALKLICLLIPFIILLTLALLLKRKLIIILPLGLCAITGLIITVSPGRKFDPLTLQKRYVNELLFYEGTTYVWGGENSIGIDCSGLVRKALINACFKEGILSLNPELLREAAFLWWNDATARSLSEGYYNQTNRLGEAKSINTLDSSTLNPGTMAVTKNGIHVLAFIENNKWIQADPGAGKVISLEATSSNSWFDSAIYLTEWQVLKK